MRTSTTILLEVNRACGATVRTGWPGASVAGATRRGSSSWQSLQRGTGSIEARYLNGEIVALGAAHRIATPVNTRLMEVAEEMAAAGEQPASRSGADLL